MLTKSGYEVVAVFLDGQGGAREEPFMTGFLVDERVYGRPVDVAVGPDGALYVSDDFTGSIYRVQYGAAAPLPAPAGGASAARATKRRARSATPARASPRAERPAASEVRRAIGMAA